MYSTRPCQELVVSETRYSKAERDAAKSSAITHLLCNTTDSARIRALHHHTKLLTHSDTADQLEETIRI